MTKLSISKIETIDEAWLSIDRKIITDRMQSQVQSKGLPNNPGTLNPARFIALVTTIISILLGFGSTTYAQSKSRTSNPSRNEAITMSHATGTFGVNTNLQKPDNKEAESANIGRMSIDKKFQGDLEATSKGEMLFSRTDVEGSGGYVAIERVSGTLRGRSGTFVLQHLGTMKRGEPQMRVSVLPDSGTGQLAGLTGTMTIRIEDGKHFYEFEYTLP